MTDHDPNTAVEWAVTTVQGLLTPALLTHDELRAYTGRFGAGTVVLIGGHLEFRSLGTGYAMIPIGDDTFLLEGLYEPRLKFLRDERARIVAVALLTRQGLGNATARDLQPDAT